MIAAAVGAVLFIAVLMITGYSKCPYMDEWWVVYQLATGASPRSLSWLWSQQNEHRILLPRLLVALDLYVFGARNISLFLFAFIVQLAHWFIFAVAAKRWFTGPRALLWTLQGLFGWCLFRSIQIENFVWAFQLSFILAFFLATLAFACVLLIDEAKRPMIFTALAAISPVLAMANLASGLLIWPTLLLLCLWQRIRRSTLLLLFGTAGFSAFVYFNGYETPSYLSSPAAAIGSPWKVFRYILTYFGTSWWSLLPHEARVIALCAIVLFGYFVIDAIRNRSAKGKLEVLLLAEGIYLLSVALATALGRIGLGTGQASSSRYQTPAMIFWGCLLGLSLLWLNKRQNPRGLLALQGGMLLIVIVLAFGVPYTYSVNLARARKLNEACAAVSAGIDDPKLTARLIDQRVVLERAGELLRKLWKPEHGPNNSKP
jgi:hypothetical protein